jgi:cobalt-zinc-cadmium efflux system outer membrane protein
MSNRNLWQIRMVACTISMVGAAGAQDTPGIQISSGTPAPKVPQAALTSTPSTTPMQRLTLEEALHLAELYNPRLKVAGAQREGALAGITTARAYPNPEFKFMAGQQSAFLNSAITGAYQDYAVNQPIELPSVRNSRIEAAQLGSSASVLSLDEARLAVRAGVKQAFYGVLRRRDELGLTQENLRLIEELRRRIQVQVQVGEAARLELIRAESEVATARVLVNSARLRTVAAIAALEATLGVPLAGGFEAQGTLEQPPVLPPVETLETEMLGKHPAIAQAQMLVRRSEVLLQNEKAQRIPRPAIEGEIERMPDSYVSRIGVVVPLPFWNRREGNIAQAVAAVREAQAVASQRRVDLTASLEVAYEQYQVTGQQIASFQQGVLVEAEAAVRAAEAAYRFGERGILDVLDAQRVLRSVRTDFLNAQYDRQAALIELERLRAVDPTGGNRP